MYITQNFCFSLMSKGLIVSRTQWQYHRTLIPGGKQQCYPYSLGDISVTLFLNTDFTMNCECKPFER